MVCQNLRPPTDARGCCQARGGAAVLERFKTIRKERKLSALFRATSSGCLGACEAGPTVAVMPAVADGAAAPPTWYSGVRPEHADEIVTNHLEGGRQVERLRTAEEWID
jgi:(2Fe-2S) ferredoxin